MGLFGKLFDKKECSVCGGEIGLLGNRKLEDGNLCKTCAGKLSSHFDGRRHSTVEDIKAHLAYREENARNLESFPVARVLGEYEQIHIEEIDGIPTRFFITRIGETIKSNPDILSFADVISCGTEIDENKEELRQKNSEGQMVPYTPPKYQYHYKFGVRIELRDHPFISKIEFAPHSDVVTLGATEVTQLKSLLSPNRRPMMHGSASFAPSQGIRQYKEYKALCEEVEKVFADSKKTPSKEEPDSVPTPDPFPQESPSTDAPRNKFCTGCGAPAEGGKFCEYCGTPL